MVLDRAPESGQLTTVQAFQDDNAADLIEGPNQRYAPPIADAIIADGLMALRGFALSRDGASIYTAGAGDNSLGVFQRDQNTGRLTFVSAHREEPSARREGLRRVSDVDVSPDSRHVYAVAYSGYLTVFERDPRTGKLTWLQEIKDQQDGISGLELAWNIAVSPAGDNVFVASSRNDSVARFQRDSQSGRLTFVGAVKDGECNCVTLENSFCVAVSPDGRHVYNCSEEHTVGVFAIPEVKPRNEQP